jgi:DhnA family fructose-bisphosphate aldolase class Ia
MVQSTHETTGSPQQDCEGVAKEESRKTLNPKKRIPIVAAQRIAEEYGYHQVVIIARRTEEVLDSGEHVTTYGTTKAHCRVAAMIGDFLKYKVMGWVQSGSRESPTKK